jgi:hypothetical protein
MMKGRLGRGKWMDLIGPVFGWLRWVSEMSECFGEAESRDRSEEGSDGGRGNGNRFKLFWGLGQLASSLGFGMADDYGDYVDGWLKGKK